MADANPDGLPPRSVEHIARFLVVSAHEDRGLIRRSRPVASEDFLNRVRHLPAMLFTNAPGAPPLPRSGMPPLLADESIIDATPRARAATQRLELAIEAADRSEQSLAAMQFALDRAHRRNLVFGVAACVVVAVSLGVATVGRAYVGGHEPAPQLLAAAAVPGVPAAAATSQTPATARRIPAAPAPAAVAAADTPTVAGAPPVPPLPAASKDAAAPSTGISAPVQTASATTDLADSTASPAIDDSSDGQPAADVAREPVSQGADPSTQPQMIDARQDNASALLRSLPPGSIIVSPLPEPAAAAPVEQPDSPVQPISVTSAATVEALPPRHHYAARRTRRYAYRTYAYRTYAYRTYRPVGRLPVQFARMVDNLGRDIRSLFE